MKKTTFGALLALAAAAPAVVAPKLVAQADAQTLAPATAAPNPAVRAEFPDVPRGHWAYEALNRLSQAGVIEGLPDGTYNGNKPMTRYEFAVAIARLLDRLPVGGNGQAGPQGIQGPQGPVGPAGAIPDVSRFATRDDLNNLAIALRREFADELARLGVRVDALENRVSTLENRVAAPPRLTFTPALLYRTGVLNTINNGVPAFLTPEAGFAPDTGQGRTVVNGNGFGLLPEPSYRYLDKTGFLGYNRRNLNGKFSYTDMELRLTDRVTDRLSASAALRSLGDTQEDAWGGNSGGGLYVREAYGVADLSDRTPFGIKGLSAIIGRQRTKIGQGLLYDNDLSPTDQIHAMFNVGPFSVGGFVGSTNNQNFGLAGGGGNPFLTTGALPNLGRFNGLVPGGGLPNGAVGFADPNKTGNFGLFLPANNNPVYGDDNESLVRVGFNVLKIAGNPVGIGLTRQFDGVQQQKGDSVDLTVPLFNRTLGFEYVRERRYFDGSKPGAFGTGTGNNPKAYNLTVPVLRTNAIDLNFAYGRADDGFEYFASSAANPFARTWGEAVFDRPLALGAPLINGNSGTNGGPLYLAAKQVYDINGTVRLPIGFLRRFPLDFRYYKAKGSDGAALGATGGRVDLGEVYSLGTVVNVTPGLDLEFKYGIYNVPGPFPNVQYARVGANVGF